MGALLEPQDLHRLAQEMYGGKAAGLLQLQQAKCAVPPWRVLPADAVACRQWEKDEKLWRELCALLQAWNASPFSGIAVRSSAAVEDSATQSFAGVFQTVFATTEEELKHALNTVAASAEAAGVNTPMAIVLQAKVDAEISGVAFSANPAAADTSQLYIEAVQGAGVGLVDGQLSPSRFALGIPNGEITSCVVGENGPETLLEKHCAELTQAVLALETLMQTAVDVEWCVDVGGKLYFLQVRPITALLPDAKLRPATWRTSWFFDQRFMEPVSPITRTTLIPLIVEVAICDAAALRWRKVDLSVLRFLRGQVYIDHSAYEAMLSGAPRWLMSQDIRALFPDHLAKRTTLFGVLHYGITAFISLCTHFNEAVFNIRTWRIFRENLAHRLKNIPDVSPEDPKNWIKAWKSLDDLSRNFFHIHRWSVLWAEYAWRIFSIITKLLPKKKSLQLQDAILSSLDLPTTQANKAFSTFIHAPDEENKKRITDHFGSRSASLDYRSPTWAELVENGNGLSVFHTPKEKESKRDQPSLGFCLRCSTYTLRRWLEMREEQRFHWERILARQRRMLLEAGELLAGKRILQERDEVFWLEWDELCTALSGEVSVDLLPLIQLRKHQHVVEALLPKPLFLGPEEAAHHERDDLLKGIGASAGVAEGRAAILRHPREFNADKHRDCIVVLPALDPAWSPLLPQARGWVIERGGILSHAAILAREYRVPLVIGVQDACNRIQNGIPIHIDGEKGEVIIDKKVVKL